MIYTDPAKNEPYLQEEEAALRIPEARDHCRTYTYPGVYIDEINIRWTPPEPITAPAITFNGNNGDAILEFYDDGRIYHQGSLIGSDREIVEGLRTFIRASGYIH